jgi:hypothetical protein
LCLVLDKAAKLGEGPSALPVAVLPPNRGPQSNVRQGAKEAEPRQIPNQFAVTGLNPLGRQLAPSPPSRWTDEESYVTWLYALRGREIPDDVRTTIRDEASHDTD